MVGIFCFIVCTGYLFIRRFFHPSLIPSLDELRCSNRFYLTLNILFFLLFSYSIIIIYLRSDPYIRPLEYFISISLMAVIVANEILFLSPQKSYIYFNLCKIIIIGLSLVYSQVLIFPNLLQIDPWKFQWFTIRILDNGYIPEGFAYSKLPLMHLMIGITSLVTDLGYKMATMFSISSLQVISDAIFIFLLGRFLISTKVGLLAALLLEISNFHIFFSCFAVPNTMAATLILPIIFILLKLRRDTPFIGTLIVIFLMGTLILTHTITALCLAILLFIFWLSSEVYTRLFHQEKDQPINWTICFLFSTSMFAYWLYVSGHISYMAYFIKIGFESHLLEYLYSDLSFIPLFEQIFNYLGLFLFFSLSFIGCFYMVSKQFRNSNRFITMIGGILILSMSFFTLLMGKYTILSRWYYFSQIFMAIPLSLSLFLLIGILKHNIIKGFLMSLLVFSLSFLLIINPIANMDNRIFSPNSNPRMAFTSSELQAMGTISKIWNGTVGADWYCGKAFEYQLDAEFVSIDYSLESGDFSKHKDILIIIREETLNHPLNRPYGSLLNVKYNPFLALEEQHFSRIYNCGSASGYLQP